MINFEVHLTTAHLDAHTLASFKTICNKLNAKPLFIQLARGVHCHQPMSTVHIHSELDEVLPCARKISERFQEHGFPIERIKIEAPFDALPITAQITEDSPRYLEWHGKVHLHDEPALIELCKQYQSHLSRNSIKGETDLRFVTIRQPLGDKTDFRHYVQRFADDLEHNGWPLVKQQFEHGIYDNRVEFDQKWLED